MARSLKKVICGLATAIYIVLPFAPAMTQAITGEITYSSTNTDLADDDYVSSGTFPIGFNFDFYGTTYTDLYISTNGAIMFDDPTSDYSNNSLPSGDFTTAILPFWDDLYTGDAKSIYYHTTGSPGSRKLIIQWTNTAFCCNLESPMGTFQAILYEGSNKIQFQYRNLVDVSRARGDEATIGIQKDSTTANMYSIDTESVTAETAISFVPNGSGGYTDNGHSDTYDLVYLYVPGAPGEATLSAPADSETGVSLTPTFEWTAGSLADDYVLTVATDSAFQDVTFNEEGITGTTFENVSNVLDPNTTYYWRVISRNDIAYTYSVIHSFTTTSAANGVPNNPASLAPDAILGNHTVDPTTLLKTPITMSLSDPDVSDKVRYQLILSKDSDPSNTADIAIRLTAPLESQGSAKYKYGQTSGTYVVGLPDTLLQDGEHYYVLVRAVDEFGAASSWVTAGQFDYEGTPGDDSDDIATSTEDASPNSGDANDDGFPDSWQENVTSISNPVTGDFSTLESSGCTTNSSVAVEPESALSATDATYNYPGGLLNFTINCANPGDTATVSQYFYALSSSNLIMRKFNTVTKSFTNIAGATFTPMTIGGKAAMKVSYSITDGGPLDEDGLANGVIVDPSGPAVLANPGAPNTGLESRAMWQYLTSLLLSAGILMYVRRVHTS